MTASPNGAQKSHGFKDVAAALGQPRVASMLALGFASGLPFLLTGATFGYWLRDEGTTLTAIGFLSWVGLAYTFKFLWAPLVDRLPAPLLGMLGRRRGWVMLAQLVIAAGLLGMAIVGPHGAGGLAAIGALALVVAFGSATQDIAFDAWRIEAASDADELGLLTSAAQLGYRVALLVTDAIILIFAQHLGWPMAYALMAVAMGVGVLATLRSPEPARADAVMQEKAHAAPFLSPRGLFDAIAGPLLEFFRAHGAFAFVMLAMISVYRLPEFLIGPVAGPFYSDLQLSKDIVGGIRGTVGLVASFAGIAAGGLCAVRLGFQRTLIMGAIMQGVGVSAYALVAMFGPDLRLFGAAMATDNFCYAFAGVALITYMSSLTSLGYTATQYALLSSIYTLFGKFLKGFSGAVVDGLHGTHTLMESYAIFYVAAGAVCVPALLLSLVIAARKPRAPTEPTAPA
jgi:MFS transporter, PAT family, beta-lactamase induction signal transducer AmpG